MDYDEDDNEFSNKKMENLRNNCIFFQKKCKDQDN